MFVAGELAQLQHGRFQVIERCNRVSGTRQKVNLFLVHDHFTNNPKTIQFEAAYHWPSGFWICLEGVLVAFFFIGGGQLHLKLRDRAGEHLIAETYADAGFRVFQQEPAKYVLTVCTHRSDQRLDRSDGCVSRKLPGSQFLQQLYSLLITGYGLAKWIGHVVFLHPETNKRVQHE